MCCRKKKDQYAGCSLKLSGQESLTEMVTLNNNLKEVEVRKLIKYFREEHFR